MRLVTVKPPYVPAPASRRKLRSVRWLAVAVVLILCLNYFRPLPKPTVALALPKVPGASQTSVQWPAQGHASLAAEGYGLLAIQAPDTPLATASIAKVITALCILEKKPLRLGEQGPLVTMTQDDLNLYNAEYEQNGSRLPIYVGEELSEYQLLQAMLIPSANNIANSAAIWAFGSMEAYITYANDFLARQGLVHTHVGQDASGFDSSTTSTAEDLAQLGLVAMQDKVIMDIAAQTSATFPFAGTLYNYNTTLGSNGITGLKTGNNALNLGGLLFTASVPIAGTSLSVSGAVLDANSLPEALAQSRALVSSVATNFEKVDYLHADEAVGKITAAWGANTSITAKDNLFIIRWKAQAVTMQKTIRTDQIILGQTREIGSVSVRTGQIEQSTSLRIEKPLDGPSFWWRLTRKPF